MSSSSVNGKVTQYSEDQQQMYHQQPLPALLGSNFCSPYPSTLFVQDGKSCIRRGIPVTVLDSQGQLAFTQEKNAKTMKVSRVMKTAEGKPVCNFLSKGMMQKVCIIYPKAEVNDADAVASVSRRSWSGRYGVEVKLAHSNDALVVVASKRWAGFFGKMTWNVIYQGQSIGQVEKVRAKDYSFLERGAYKVTLNPSVDQAFMACVIIILDIYRQQDQSIYTTGVASSSSSAAIAASS